MKRLVLLLVQKIGFGLNKYMVSNSSSPKKIREYLFVNFYFIYKRIFEQEIIRFLNVNLHRFDVILDVGGGLGYYSKMIIENANRDATIHIFEPDQLNYRRIERITKNLGKPPNFFLNRIALSDKTASLNFLIDQKNPANHRVTNDKNGIQIPSTTVDAYMKNYTYHKCLIKIDVQGHELQVLIGAESFLERDIWILIEFDIENFEDECRAIWSLLISKGNTCYSISKKGKLEVQSDFPSQVTSYKDFVFYKPFITQLD